MTEEILALIPARAGSKGIPGKNLIPLAGFPLLAYSIAACRLARRIDRIVVTTDSEEIASVARVYGAETPFLRPAALAGDASTDLEFVRHALDWFRDKEKKEPSYLVHIRPTTPLRDPALLDRAVESIRSRPEATGLRSVHEIPESPYKLFGIEGEYLVGLYPSDPRREYYNLPRQAFPPVYRPNGYVDVIKRDTVRSTDSLHGARMLAFRTPDAGELDRPEDLPFLEHLLPARGAPLLEYLRGINGRG